MMMKRVALALMLMCVPHTASAQASSASGSLSAQYASSCAPTTCVTLGMGNMSGVGVQVTGTWVGTLSFLASVDGVQPYVAVSMTPFASSTTATTATANGAWSASVVAQFVQVRFTARTSGTAVVRMRAVPLVAKVSSGGGGSTTPGGSNTQVQFNDTTAFGGSAFTYNKLTGRFTEPTSTIVIQNLTAVATPSGGSTSYEYYVVALFADGSYTQYDGPDVSISDGPAALDSTHYVTLTWTAVPGATSYEVYADSRGNEAHYGELATVVSPTYRDDGSAVGNDLTPYWSETVGGVHAQYLTGTLRGIQTAPTQVADVIVQSDTVYGNGTDVVIGGGAILRTGLIYNAGTASAVTGSVQLTSGSIVGTTAASHVAGDIVLSAGTSPDVVDHNGQIVLGSPQNARIVLGSAFPTSDPLVTSRLWSNGGVVSLSGTAPTHAILSGNTGAIGGGALAAGACTAGTAAVTGATTAMVAIASPVTYPGDGTDWSAYVSATGTVTVKVCALVVVTPTSTVYNVRVVQ